MSAAVLPAQNTEVYVENANVRKNGDYVRVSMDMDLSSLDVESNRAVLLTPWLSCGDSTLCLSSIGVYGYTRWCYYIRKDIPLQPGVPETSYLDSKKPSYIPYEVMVPLRDWMTQGDVNLSLHRADYGCCSEMLDESLDGLYDGFIGEREVPVFKPELIYVSPKAEAVKRRELHGSAFINFPVNETLIYQTYLDNVRELAKIQSTIDSVRLDSDITVTAMSIKGFASPEGTYANNVRLAKGRTEALKEYVRKLYAFPEGFIATDFQPENWEGLEAYVLESSLEHKAEILDAIAMDREPDAKEWIIKSRYPEDYKLLLKDCYPYLRRSDYKVEYVIRDFASPEEIRQVLYTRPQKLSLNELYHLASSLEKGSEDFNYVFDVAVRMYPDDPVANLNAANIAMSKNDPDAAAKYLSKAPATAEADYARGVCAAMSGDYARAKEYFSHCSDLAETSDALAQIEQMENFTR